MMWIDKWVCLRVWQYRGAIGWNWLRRLQWTRHTVINLSVEETRATLLRPGARGHRRLQRLFSSPSSATSSHSSSSSQSNIATRACSCVLQRHPLSAIIRVRSYGLLCIWWWAATFLESYFVAICILVFVSPYSGIDVQKTTITTQNKLN